MIFHNARLIFPDRIQPAGSVRVLDGKLTQISVENIAPAPGEEVVDVAHRHLAPGFIDLHVHGALRRDTMEADDEAFAAICDYHATGGTTSLALTTVTAPTEEICRVLRAVESFRNKDLRVLGVHVEGPYLSKEKAGAQRVKFIRNPEPRDYEAILAFSHLITQMTLAPELPGALELVGELLSRGIRASGGHSNAWDEEAGAAFAHGMRRVTHTFNCMSSTRRRGAYRVAGLLEFALSEPEILCELIADGRHVPATLMRMLLHAKGADGICLVTDATAGAGLPSGAAFRLADIDCVVRDDVGFLADGTALAGSTAKMSRLVRNMVTLAGASLVEAVRMASLVPARSLELEEKKGQLAVGADADLVILSDDLEVVRTYARGDCVFDRKAASAS
jgi:N-acetylglucosamine-6-phosphate deacetylase